MVTREQEPDPVKPCEVCKKPVPTQKWYWSTFKQVYISYICTECYKTVAPVYLADPFRDTYAEAEYDLLLKKLS